MILWCSGEVDYGICIGVGVHGPLLMSYDPAMAERPAIPYSAKAPVPGSLPRRGSRRFAQWAMGCSNPPFNNCELPSVCFPRD